MSEHAADVLLRRRRSFLLETPTAIDPRQDGCNGDNEAEMIETRKALPADCRPQYRHWSE
jgi:hypothetical protein